MGEESIIVGVMSALGETGQAFGYYRSHALYLTITEDPLTFFLELYGKSGGAVGGRGGSMHLSAPEHGLLGVSAIVASTVAPAVGAAFSNKYLRNEKIVATFFGDGAFEEGVVLESLNVACLMQLPIIFVCEDNGLAVDVLASERQGFHSIPSVVRGYRCLLIQSESTDPCEIYKLSKIAVEHIRNHGTPVFMHLKYYRLLQHIGITNDFENSDPSNLNKFERSGYRSKQEYEKQLALDPVILARSRVISSGLVEERISEIEYQIDESVKQAILKAKVAEASDIKGIYSHVYPNRGY